MNQNYHEKLSKACVRLSNSLRRRGECLKKIEYGSLPLKNLEIHYEHLRMLSAANYIKFYKQAR